jgi:hypothetical protein
MHSTRANRRSSSTGQREDERSKQQATASTSSSTEAPFLADVDNAGGATGMWVDDDRGSPQSR